jgi:hypothetical protein
MYSTLQTPMQISNNRHKAMLIPQPIAMVLRKYNLPSAPYKATATINPNRTISVTTPQGYPPAFYKEYYTEMGKAVQECIKPTLLYCFQTCKRKKHFGSVRHAKNHFV